MDAPVFLNQAAINTIRDWLAKRTGLDHASLGAGWIEETLERRRMALGCASMLEYSGRLFLLPDEQRELIQATLVHESWFFRDPAAFTCMRNQVRVLGEKGRIWALQPFRVLSLPCAAGEEAYSIAMELTDAGLEPREFRVEAADISAEAVARAREAVFREGSVRGAKLEKLERYLQRNEGEVRVVERIRAVVTFRVENAMQPEGLKRLPTFDAIFCRNMLVYFTDAAKTVVIDHLIGLMRPEGILYFGHADVDTRLSQKLTKTEDRGAFAYRLLRTLGEVKPAPSMTVNLAPAEKTERTERTEETKGTEVIEKTDEFLVASRLADAGRNGEALLVLDRLVRMQPLHAGAWGLRGVLLQEKGAAREAEVSLRKALYVVPNDEDALLHLALLLEDQGRLEEAGRLRRRLKRSSPSHA